MRGCVIDVDEPGSRTEPFLAGGGQMGALIRAYDWSTSSLGPPENWPQSLRTVVRLMLTTGNPIYVFWGADSACLYNDAYARSIGPERHPSSLGRPGLQVWAEIWDIIGPQIEQVMSGRGATWHENHLVPITRRGRREDVYWTYSYSPIDDETAPHGIGGVLVVCAETTREVLAARRAAAERDYFARLFEQAPSFMAMLRGPEHRFEKINPGYMKLIGHRDVIGKTVAEALPDAVASGYLDLLDEAYRTGNAYVGSGAKYSAQPVIGGPIDERYIDFVCQPIVDPDGATTGIFIEGFDVTGRKRVEAELRDLNATLNLRIEEATSKLRASEALIQTFFDHSSECHAVLAETREGSFRYEEINPASLRLYGKTRTEVIGRLTEDVVGPEVGATLNQHFAACLSSGLPYCYERIQGNKIVEAVATPVPEIPGHARHVVVSARDVTESRHLEEQLRQAQKMEAIGQLTGGLAHDFNNLLAGILGSLELSQRRLAEGRVDALGKYIDAAQGAARRAASLTQRLLAFSRRQTLDARAVNLNRVVAEMEELIRRTVGPSIHVEVIGASGLWPALVDPAQLDSALLNLCINARDAMPDGGRLTLETANKRIDDRAAATHNLAAGQYVSLCVTDTGTGMTSEIIARIFDPFFTTKPLGEGTGLGLSMVYGFTRQSGGEVRVYSELGKGTTMCLYLPRHTGEAAADDPVSTPAVSVSVGNNQTVLVIDDEPLLRMLIAEVLVDEGYNVVEAHDGPSGLKILQSSEPINLLITDVGLPGGMNGRQVAEAARALRPGLKMLFITGYAENSVLGNKLVEPGMKVLTKPFAADDLTRVVRELIASA